MDENLKPFFWFGRSRFGREKKPRRQGGENIGRFRSENLGRFRGENLGRFRGENLGRFRGENLGEN